MRLKQGCRIPEVLLLLTLCSSLAVCSDSDTPWSSIVDTPEYKSLAGCAQECVYDVTIVTNCTVYSCVCSGNTNGDNFLMGWTYIDTCTTEGCQDQSAANEALLAFRDICAGDTPTSSTTSTTQTPKTTSTTIPPTLPTTENGQPGGGGSSSNPPAPTRASSSSTPTSTNTPGKHSLSRSLALKGRRTTNMDPNLSYNHHSPNKASILPSSPTLQQIHTHRLPLRPILHGARTRLLSHQKAPRMGIIPRPSSTAQLRLCKVPSRLYLRQECLLHLVQRALQPERLFLQLSTHPEGLHLPRLR